MSTIRTKVAMGSSFLAFSHAYPRRVATQSREVAVRMRREDVIARRGSSLCSEHVDRDCFKTRSLLRRDYARGEGSYMRKPGRASKVTAIPTRLAHTQSVEWRCSPGVSLAKAKRRAQAQEGNCLCGLGHHNVVPCDACVCFLFLFLAAKKVVCE